MYSVYFSPQHHLKYTTQLFSFSPSFLIQQGKMQLNIIQCIPSPFLNGFFGNYSSSYSAPAMADLTGEQSPSRATLTQDPVSVTGKKHTHHLYQRKELNVLFTPPPCTVSKIAQSFLFFSCPCDILLYIVSEEKHFLLLPLEI